MSHALITSLTLTAATSQEVPYRTVDHRPATAPDSHNRHSDLHRQGPP